MGDNKDNIDKLFSEGFKGFEPDTPFDGWQGVKAKIAKSKQKKRALIFRWSAVCLAILMAFFAGYKIQNLNTHSEQDPILDEKQITHQDNDVNLKNRVNEIAPENEGLENEDPLQNTILKQEKTRTKANELAETSNSVDPRPTSLQKNEINGNTPEKPNKKARKENPSFEPLSRGPQEDLLQLAFLGISSDKTRTDLELSSNNNNLVNNKASEDLVEPYSSLATYPSKIRRAFFDFEIGIYVGPSLPSRTVSFNNADEITQNNVANEQLANTNTYGIQLSKRWKNIEYGIGFFQSEWRQTSNNIILKGDASGNAATNYNDRVRGTTSIGDFTLNISNGAPIQPALETGHYIFLPNILQEYQFIDIPVSASYFLVDRRFKLKLQLGVTNRILSKSIVQLEFPDGTKEDFGDLIPEAYSLQFNSGLGLSYQLFGSWNFNLIPIYSYGLSPISIQEGATTRQHQLSILSGISYRF